MAESHAKADPASATSAAGTGISRRHVLGLFGAGGLGGLLFSGFDWPALRAETGTIPPITVPEGSTAVPERLLVTVADKAAELDYDTQRIFEFVRDEIVYEPYSGVLRGASGTLRSGAGNAADQAVLLAALLGEARVVTRFVEAPLDEATSTRLIKTTELDRAQADAVTSRLFEAVISDDASTETSEPDDETVAEMERLTAASKAAGVAMGEAIGRTAEQLDSILRGAGVTLPDVVAAIPELEQSRHIWVQYADGPAWIDLDASARWAEAGGPAATEGTELAVLPDEWFHRVTLRIRVEEVVGTGVAQRTLVEHQVKSADVVGVPLSIVHTPPAMFADTGFAIVEALTGVATLYPTIAVGPDAVVDQPISIVQGAGGGVADVFSGESSPTDTVAEWLDVELVGPGRNVTTETRTIFDRAGAELRAAGGITAEAIEPAALTRLDTAPELGEFYPPLMALRTVWITGARIAHLPSSWDTETNGLALLAGLPAAFRPTLDAAEREALHTRGFRTVIQEPSIIMATYAVTAADGSEGATVGIDIVNNGTTVLPLSDTAGDLPGGLLAGVASHVAERSLLDGTLATPFGLEVPPREARSVGRLFELAAEQGIAFRVHQPSAPVEVPEDASAEARELIIRALDSGLVVIAPERTIEIGGHTWLGWWLVDPVTGVVRDQFESGESTELTDFGAVLNYIVGRAFPAYKRLGCAVAIIVMVAQILAWIGSANSSLTSQAFVTAKTIVNTLQAGRAC